jgi:squalene-associated FAD-dependent desaturase
VESSELSFAIHRTHLPRIAVIGGGLAGIQATGVLAKHGCHVELFEARHRLGGRVGSFDDSGSNRPVDYCQHVGMKCCKELLRWISDQGQADDWQEQSTLYFRSRKGVPFRVKAWPIPAPYHLAGLLLRWPDLGLIDRIGIAKGLLRLLRIRPDEQFSNTLAIDWLKANGQSQSAILNFWTTILVSALGDQLPRLRMGAVRKVMVDGFAATRDAYHLYVPNRPLSELVDVSTSKVFDALGVASHYGQVVTGLVRSEQGKWSVSVRSLLQSSSNDRCDASKLFDAVVVAVPWYRLSSVLSQSQLIAMGWSESQVAAWSSPGKLASAPITGVHTWWTKRWLPTPHAILIDRTSQWVFPGPDTSRSGDANVEKEFYYQVVISGSRDLPKGDPAKIAEIVEADLREVFPEISSSGARMLRSKVVTDPHSVFSVDSSNASDIDTRADVSIDGRLPSGMFSEQGIILAGDWTQTGWPATMEGAIRSGSLAAQCALGLLGRPAQIATDAE